jgi:hypothetical protein
LLKKNTSGSKFYSISNLQNCPDLPAIDIESIIDIQNHQFRETKIWYLISYKRHNIIKFAWIKDSKIVNYFGLLNYKLKNML